MNKSLTSLLMAIIILFLTVSPSGWMTASAAGADPVTFTPTWNVALNATATASGQCNSNESAANAVDGRTDTKWCDNTAKNKKWLKLDLGQVYNINEWVVKNAAIGESSNSPFWNTKNFRLEKSEDGVTWEDVDVVRNNAQTIVDRYVPTFSARYVRFYVDNGAYDSNTVRLYEFEVYGVNADQTPAVPIINLDPVDYVDPFINTLGDNGQTNPGPSTPFGLVSLGPDSDGGAFSGYYYQDKSLKGFSHLRFSGVGCSGAGGNILMMPETRAFTKNSNEYKQSYDKSSELASPGYYAVGLASGIGVELTASDNVGFHRYTFPSSGAGSVLVDLSNSYAGMIDANLTVNGSNEISGMVQSKNVCGNGYYKMYFSIQFDHDFDSYTSWSGDSVGTEASRSGSNSGVWVNFDSIDGGVVQAKVGLSPVSVEQAKYERDHDIEGWNFEAQREKARGVWSDLLNKVEITDSDEENKTVFYTQMYHSFLHPKNVTSSLGTFKAGRDEDTVRNVSEIGDDFEYYNGWTTWDDYRKYSLFSLFEPKKFENMVKSLVDLYGTRGSYTQWGDGYWPSPTVRNEFNGAVILDAYAKGFTDFDAYKALQGMAVDADNFSISDGEISGKLEKANSASFPMKLAQMLGDQATYEKYKKLALSYKDLWNPSQVDETGTERGFFTPNGSTVAQGDVTAVDKYAYQGNLWTYRWSVPQDVNGLAELMGGKTEMAKQLQHFFEIGEYVAINEPDLHAPYLFDYLGYPYLTQYYAREYTTEVVTQNYHNHGRYNYPIKSRVYRDDPEGYLPSMDDDAGGMSSWFVFSALGLFPGSPGDPYYLIGSPIFSEVKLHLDGGKTFTIKANGVSSDNRFIQSAQLNGQNFNQAWIDYSDIMDGGTLEFQMGAEPNAAWGAVASAAPPTTDYDTEVDDSLTRQELIAEQSTWKYYDKGQYSGEGWTSLDFDDSAWSSGPAMLGYDKFGNPATTVSYGPDANNKYPTTYFRKTFEAENADRILQLDASLIRDDGAVVYLNGNEIIRTNMPSGSIGYDTYANATVNDERDRNAYSIDPSYLVEGTNVLTAEVHQSGGTSSDIAFEFSLAAVRQLDKPTAPTEPVVDDEANTFGWTNVAGFEEPSDYEFSTNGGASWTTATANPQPVGPMAYEEGQVQVRVKANAEQGHSSSEALVSDKAYTPDILEVFDLDVDVKGSGNMNVAVQGKLKGAYNDTAVAVFQLMDGSDKAWMTSAVPVPTGDFDLTQLFNVNADKYEVNVYLVDSFNGNIYDSLWLAQPSVSKPEPKPAPGSGSDPDPEPPVEEPLPEFIPLPDKEPEEPIDPIEPDEPEVPGVPGALNLQFEENSSWSTEVNSFNNRPMQTEDGNKGKVVANTFDGAWLAFEGVDFGDEGANRLTVEYDAPAAKVPAGSSLEVRLGSVDGELVGTIALPSTGSSWGTYGTATGLLERTIVGTQNVYIVLKGNTSSSLPYIGNFDWLAFDKVDIRSDYADLELETYDEWSTAVNPVNNGPLKTENGQSGKQVANTFSGAWLAYKNMDFGSEGVNQVSILYAGNSTNTAADSAVEVRLGGIDGELVGTIAAPPTGGNWSTYETVTGTLTRTVTGMQDLYLVLVGSTDSTYKYIGNFDKASFAFAAEEPDPEEPENPDPGEDARSDFAALELETYDEWSTSVNPANNNPLGTEKGQSGQQIKNTFDGAWLAYKKMDFGSEGVNRVSILYVGNSTNTAADSAVEIRLGGADGELVGTIAAPPTGGNWTTYANVTGDLTRTVTGVQDLYFVLVGTTDSTYKYIGNFDKASFSLLAPEPDVTVEFENRSSWSTDNNTFNNQPLKAENNNGGTTVSNTFNGMWLLFDSIDFGVQGKNRVSIVYDAPSDKAPADVVAEIRLNDKDGEIIGTVNLPNTGTGWGTYKSAQADLSRTVAGQQKLYVSFRGTTTSSLRYVGNLDRIIFSKG
ncbi:glycoside hydrolase domain-containing protein [Cohnella thailandensis]|uniref:Glycoside hydrolase family 92 protein n=1 Tax=Cohnella thailandensis TaxID=557557 RepID=A0A841SZE5_9BACL|nr:glycoside hydrolase domain-containing protein [Cohnella thailandensis]MBB6636006.1 glycoside hydrolase family 92 protein [Cohnella thailandensis]MBP1976385.1 putative alpha-1,2-mannosidase [Cohnella thailandensis]